MSSLFKKNISLFNSWQFPIMWDNTYMKLINIKNTVVNKENGQVFREDTMEFLDDLDSLKVIKIFKQRYIVV